MKKILILSILLISFISLSAEFNFFGNNPATLANRNQVEFRIPGFNLETELSNSILSLENLKIFDTTKYEDGSLMSDKDKAILTAKDLDVMLNLKAEIFGYGYDNWDFSLQTIIHADMELLDKQYTKIVFYGNEANKDYVVHSGENSKAFSFIKSSLKYAYPEPMNIGMINSEFENYLKTSKLGQYLNEMPIWLGANINLYYTILYGEVLDSDQYFGAMVDSLYYNYQIHAKYSDASSNGKLSAGIGFGTKIGVLENGWAYFSLDDIFANLTYRDLAGITYEGVFVDSLLYLEGDNYEAFNESTQDDSTRYKKQTVNIKPTVTFGFEYIPITDLTIEAKYENCNYGMRNGFSLGAGYLVKKIWPIKIICGYGNGAGFSELQTGLKFNFMEYDLAFSSSGGIFNKAKGIGFKTGLKFKF